MAGTPTLMPEVTNGLLSSKGTAFLFKVICALSNVSCAFLPVRFLFLRSMSIKWLSVPLLIRLYPLFTNASAMACAFVIICLAYCVYSSVNISPNDTALAAITCSSGPPCIPGNTARSRRALMGRIFPLGSFTPNGLSKSFRIITIPPLGPRSVLWVVELTIWQCSNGSFSRPFAINPAGCAMSASTKAPMESATSRMRL